MREGREATSTCMNIDTGSKEKMTNNVPVSFYKGTNPETGKNGFWGVEVTFNFFSSMISPKLTMGIIIGCNSKEPKEEHLLFQYFLQWINGKYYHF